MKGLVDKLVKSFVSLLLPRLIAELTKAVEQLVGVDINGDGVVGFPGKGETDDK